LTMGSYTDALLKVLEIQSRVRNVHSLFNDFYPIAVVSDNTFEIFDVPPDMRAYEHIKSEPCPFPLPEGVRAAFPLECYNGRISAVITPDAFDTLEGYVLIMHEFVHCAQYNTCETGLKEQLNIYWHYKKINDYAWEINHPFPYTDQSFIDVFGRYLRSLSGGGREALNHRREFRQIVNEIDCEYILWQEWKEGYARFLENKIRNLLGAEENHFGSEPPYGRISFLESGSRFISVLDMLNPSITNAMDTLFTEMKKYAL